MGKIDWSKQVVSYCAETNEQYHRSRVIILDGQWYLGEFKDMEQFKRFCFNFGLECEFVESRPTCWKPSINCDFYKMSHQFVVGKVNGYDYFWKLSDLPEDVLPIPLLSNGCIVTGYYKVDDEKKTITIYRPNPNAKEVYKPLSVEAHIAYIKKYGLF